MSGIVSFGIAWIFHRYESLARSLHPAPSFLNPQCRSNPSSPIPNLRTHCRCSRRREARSEPKFLVDLPIDIRLLPSRPLSNSKQHHRPGRQGVIFDNFAVEIYPQCHILTISLHSTHLKGGSSRQTILPLVIFGLNTCVAMLPTRALSQPGLYLYLTVPILFGNTMAPISFR